MPPGFFDQTAVGEGWFDETISGQGWFDRDLVDTEVVVPPAPPPERSARIVSLASRRLPSRPR